jgi:hypothetical protein
MSDVFYMVFRVGKRGPVNQHETLSSAIAEASRLAELDSGRFYILQSVGYVDRPKVPLAYVDLTPRIERGDK